MNLGVIGVGDCGKQAKQRIIKFTTQTYFDFLIRAAWHSLFLLATR